MNALMSLKYVVKTLFVKIFLETMNAVVKKDMKRMALYVRMSMNANLKVLVIPMLHASI